MATKPDVQRERLLALIEFARQSAALKSKAPAGSVSDHGLFSFHEHEVQDLPGIRLNFGTDDDEDETWLSVARLNESSPPEVLSAILRPWIRITSSPGDEPRLRHELMGESLIAVGTHVAAPGPPDEARPSIDPGQTIELAGFAEAASVEAEFASYCETLWRPWASAERLVRRTTTLYAKLFTLKQQLEGGIVESQLELVWGVGIGVWNLNGRKLSYPLVSQQVELTLDASTAAIEIRPRDLDPRLEIDWFASVNNPGVAALEIAERQFFDAATTTFSPFDRGTFESVLRMAVTNLHSSGVYWPDEVPPEDRNLPTADHVLRITDTWVVFARPRTNSVFLQDLQNFKALVEEAAAYPAAVSAVVTDPEQTNSVVELPTYRGVSALSGTGTGDTAKDLFFPKPFNDEQVRIVQLLEVSDGVVVQGPPGTGKTHTIANVICHYLAHGKRVLVTSMKDPALAVLHEQLPSEIRPLAISLLTSEREGMKQFEHSIHKIASEVQALDRSGTSKRIKHLEESITALHSKLALIDRSISEWAERNLTRIELDSETIEPEDAARQVVEGEFEWIPDALGISPEYAPRLNDSDVVRLRDARRTLGQDIDYLNCSLPQLVQLPDSRDLLQVHQDLSQHETLKRGIEVGEVPAMADSSAKTLDNLRLLLEGIEQLRLLRETIMAAQQSWTTSMTARLRRGGDSSVLNILELLGIEAAKAVEARTVFLERPVSAPTGAELNGDVVDAISHLVEGKKPFGLVGGLLGKSGPKKLLQEITVLARPPKDDEWTHVSDYLALQKHMREIAIRWNVLTSELELPSVNDEVPDGGFRAAEYFSQYLKVTAAVEAEKSVIQLASAVFPKWPDMHEAIDDGVVLGELERAARHHLAKSRLAEVWATKERLQQILEGRSGRVVGEIRRFLAEVLGNPRIGDAEMQAAWSALTAELSRVLGLASLLAIVAEIAAIVAECGAPIYSEGLKRPPGGAVDALLPDDWRKAWRLRRLATYLQSLDPGEQLKKLNAQRREVEGDLSGAYRDVVVKRTWLKLAENASPSIRAALQAYLNAIQKIGKGTGKRAVRYRQDARRAASQANAAVPCWIMPHYRASESLPPELGCFDLVVIDEASQSDLTALPCLLRAQKVLIVGDDKQVSPEGVGVEEGKVISLMNRFLGDQVPTYRAQMAPVNSIYDLFKVVFAKSNVMLKEHFRCVPPIIEYSKREFYNHELRPLRVPRASERLDPPLIDVLVEDGYRQGDLNASEAAFIVREIEALAADPEMVGRSIGVVSLLGDKQALNIWDRLTVALGPELMERHHIACGDARTFQGKERDIMFLSMVSAPNEVGAPLSRDTFAQRFNVAASRARDRMYLVRSVDLKHLSEADRLRRSLITHFATPFVQDETRVADQRTLCESPFEREMYDELTRRGFSVTPQVRVGQFRIDMVVEGHNDARLAIECDGDQYHGPDKWADDMQRQRVLERAGWTFWRCFASAFVLRRQEVLEDLLRTFSDRGIEPIAAEGAPRSVHTEHRNVRSEPETQPHDETDDASIPLEPLITGPNGSGAISGEAQGVIDQSHFVDSSGTVTDAQRPTEFNVIDRVPRGGHTHPTTVSINPQQPMVAYVAYTGIPGRDPRTARTEAVAEGLVRIVEVEGPMLAKRAYDLYLRSCGIKRMGHELKSMMNKALNVAINQGRVVSEDESGSAGFLYSIVRMKGTPSVRVRARGPRVFEEIPPSELQAVSRQISQDESLAYGSEEHIRRVLDCYDLKRLTTQVNATFVRILKEGSG